MKELFLLAEKITGSLKEKLSIDREQIGIINFENAIIGNSMFEITFKGLKSLIKIRLSVHHLDMPWEVEVFVNTMNLKDLIDRQNLNVFEANPKLLKDPDGLGLELSNQIAEAIIKYLNSKID